jgi:uncharacterized protein YeaO (DUF488 family)
MSIAIVRLGTPRKPGEGLRIGTVRRPPRGVPKADFASLDYYDVWFPNLAPSDTLVREALSATDARAWAAFRRKYRHEMKAPDRSRELDVLAALSHPQISPSAVIAKTRAAAIGRSCANS